MLRRNTASTPCSTLGTAGNPTAVLQRHRSAVLHGLGADAAETTPISTSDWLLPCAPLFHVDCQGIPFAAPGAGDPLERG